MPRRNLRPAAGIASVLAGACAVLAFAESASTPAGEEVRSLPERPVVGEIRTTRAVPGVPYELAGNRIVFTNWYFIQPGDLDWRDAAGKSVYVHGDSALDEAQHVGINAPRGVRIRADRPAEIVGPLERPHRMILRENGLYKGWTDSDYYESKDAVRWEHKAALQMDAPLAKERALYQVFVDPSATSDRRYKAVWTGNIDRGAFEDFRRRRPDGWEPRAALHLAEHGQVACLRGGVSADGIRWVTLADPLVVEYCDTWNTAYYDKFSREYVIYTRQWSVGPRTDRLPPDIRNSWTGVGRRAIGRTASRDFHRFSPSELILEPTPDMLPSEQLYTNCYTTVPGAPDHHLMFPTIWNGSVDDTTRVALASSHDGRVWHWVPGGDMLQTREFGRWDGGCIWGTPNLIELPNGDWALPYMGHNVPHKYPRGQLKAGLGYAVWPRGRLVAVEAEDTGEFTMMTVMAPGTSLKINAVTQRTGWVKVEVAGVGGRSFADCNPIVGDQFWKNVSWKGESRLGVEAGKPVTLRISLKQAKIYGLQFD